MHSLKSNSPKKSDLKLPPDSKRSSPIKKQDGRDNIIGTTAPSKHMPHSSSWTKSVFKNDFIDAKSALLQQKQPSKGLIKRKVEKFTNETEKKKMKPVVSTSAEENATPMKKETKRKSVFPKTSASYVCKYCCRRFRSIELLRDHTSTHGSKPSYVCYLCGTEAGAFSSLMAHFVKHSRTRSILKSGKLKNKTCNLEDFSLSSPKSPIRCSHCKLSFPSTEKLASHYCPIAGKKSEYNCAYCGQISSSIDDYRLHVLSHSVTPFLCMHCNFKGPTKKLLDKHVEVCKKKPKILNENLVYKCKNCSIECKHKKEFNQHLKMCKQASDCKVTFKSCPNCSSVFSNKYDFDNHVLSCSVSENNTESNVKESSHCNSELNKESAQEESFLCSHCGEVFHDQTDHENHQVICFEDELTLNERTSALCQTCGGIFPATIIKEHQKQCLKSDEKSGKELDKETCESDADSPSKRRSARLVRRKSSFSDDSPKCKDSPRKRKLGFQEIKEARKANISKTKNIIKVLKGRRGRQSKVGNADFKCNYCDLTFCSKSTLLRHKRMHSGNPYFSCKYCGKFFFRKDVYTRHEVNVHSKSTHEAFSCYYCKLYFEDPLTLKEHVLATHKENAFLPVKTEFIGDINQDIVLSPLDIKKEPSASEVKTNEKISAKNTNSKNDILNSSTPLKKCGICLETFKNISDIEKHLQSHKRTETCNISEACSPTHQVDQIPDRNKDISFENQYVDNEDLLPLNSLKINTSTPAVIHLSNPLSNLPKQSEQSLIQNSDVPDCLREREFDKETDCIDMKNYMCKLCLNSYSSKALLTSHQGTEHKIIDWYQCLVCDTSGPKQDMIEHMFSHMYRVGSIVVSNTSTNLDALLPFTQNPVSKENRVINKDSDVQIENTPVIITENTLNERSRVELPSLIDYGSDNCNFLQNVSSFSDEAPSQNNDQCAVSDNRENNNVDFVTNYFEEDNTLSQKVCQGKNADSEIEKVHDQVDVIESPCSELINHASPKNILVELCNPVNTTLLESSLGENSELSKQLSKETFKIQNATPLSPKPLINLDSSKKLLFESSNSGSTNVLNSLAEKNSKISQLFLEDTLQNTIPLSPKPLLNLSPKELHVESSNCGNSKLLKSSDVNSGLSQQCLEETLEAQNTTPLSLKPLISLASPKKMHVEPSNCVNTNLSKSSLTEENSKLPKQFPKETLKTQNIISSESKPPSVEEEVGNSGGNINKTSETLGDCTSSGANFSQLRYLLETFKKTDPIDAVVCSNKKTDEPNYQLHILEDDESCTDSCIKNDNLSWLNSLQSDKKKDLEMTSTKHFEEKQKNIDHIGFQSSLRSINASTSFNRLPSENTEHFSKVLPNSNRKHLEQHELNQNVNTCLKFDINQSRSIFSENELFQTSQVQNKILDFSDLIGDTINLNNNIFQCDQVPTASSSTYIPNTSLSNKYTCSNSNRSIFSPEVHKCNNCNLKFNDANEVALHICSKNLTFTNCINSPYNFEPKNIFFPPSSRTNSPGIVDYDKTPTEKYIAIETINDIFSSSHANSVSNKVQSPHFEMDQINNSSSNHTCNNCYRMFCDVKELANHSINCLKPSWCKSDEASDGLKFPETLHSLLAKGETRTQQHNYSISAENDTSYDTVLNLSKNPFSS